MTDSGQSVQCEVLTYSEQIVEKSSAYNDKDQTVLFVCEPDRIWTDFRRLQWTE